MVLYVEFKSESRFEPNISNLDKICVNRIYAMIRLQTPVILVSFPS